MQLCEWLRRTAAYSVAVIALRYQRQLDMADSAGRMINLAQLFWREPFAERATCGSSTYCRFAPLIFREYIKDAPWDLSTSNTTPGHVKHARSTHSLPS
jgi:hypothetical protein